MEQTPWGRELARAVAFMRPVALVRAVALAAVASAVLGAIAAACAGRGATQGGSATDAGPGDATGTDASTTHDGSVAPDGDATDGASPDAGSSCPGLPAATLVPSATPALTVQGDPGSSLGIYDPSLVYTVAAAAGVMSYSTVSPNSVHTRVAVTSDHGATFQYAAEPNEVTPVVVSTTDPAFCDAGPCAVSGVLWHEVSSIVSDPGDPAAPYKLFFHTYASVAGGAVLRRDWGTIGMQTATTPDAWSPETKLLGWQSDATLSTEGVSQVLTDLAQLKDCVAFTEPGAIVTPLGIDLALSCVYPAAGTIAIRVVLLRSTDHARSFAYVSDLVSANDFGCLDGGAAQVLGPDLFTVAGNEYVVVSPVGPVSNTDAGGYRGCAVIPVADASSGAIARTDGGAPAVVRWVEADDGRFTGPCTYAEGATATGLLVPMQFTDESPPWFRILPTTIAVP